MPKIESDLEALTVTRERILKEANSWLELFCKAQVAETERATKAG